MESSPGRKEKPIKYEDSVDSDLTRSRAVSVVILREAKGLVRCNNLAITTMSRIFLTSFLQAHSSFYPGHEILHYVQDDETPVSGSKLSRKRGLRETSIHEHFHHWQ